MQTLLRGRSTLHRSSPEPAKPTQIGDDAVDSLTSLMRLASWNVNGVQARMQNLLAWLAERQPDVVGLQELRTAKHLPLRRLEDIGY